MIGFPVVLIGAEDQPGMLMSGPYGLPEVRSETDGQAYGPGEAAIMLLEPAEDPDDHALVERGCGAVRRKTRNGRGAIPARSLWFVTYPSMHTHPQRPEGHSAMQMPPQHCCPEGHFISAHGFASGSN